MTTNASPHARCLGTSQRRGASFQYGTNAVDRYSASRSAVYTAWMNGSSVLRESKS
jgi:hypothetical protein